MEKRISRVRYLCAPEAVNVVKRAVERFVPKPLSRLNRSDERLTHKLEFPSWGFEEWPRFSVRSRRRPPA
jgi:hypothetical protein